MSPLSADLPKPMMPLWGKPLIVHLIERLREWGVGEILVNLHHHPNPIFDYFRRNGPAGVRLTFSFEAEILGTGGALRRAGWFVDGEPFWMANTDIAADLDPRPFLSAFARRHPLAVLWLDSVRGPRTVETRGRRITNFRSSRAGSPGTATFCGLQLVSPEVLKWIPERPFSSIIEAYEAAMKAGRVVAGLTQPAAFWSDLGSPACYRVAHRETWGRWRRGLPGARLFVPEQRRGIDRLRRAGVTVEGFVSVGEGVTIQPGARLRDCVLWDGARIGRQASLEDCVVGREARIEGAGQGVAVSAARLGGDTAVRAALRMLGWEAEGVTLLPLAARGSDREFIRLARGRRTAIFVEYGSARPENARYMGHARFLAANGVPVPGVLADLPDRSAAVFEDVGDVSLQVRVEREGVQRVEGLYRSALEALLAMHAIPAARFRRVELEPGFDAALYRWERELFAEHLLRQRLGLGESAIRGITKDLECAAKRLLKAPRVLVHRDMQSSNVLIRRGRPVFIDFQGMRSGPAAYDLASLLCDPYVMLPPDLQLRLLEYYLGRCRNAEAVLASFWPAAVERLAQALGAFARLSARPETRRFADYIEPGLAMMRRALERVAGVERLKRFSKSARELRE